MRVLQLLPEARPADAVTNQALDIARALRELGHETALGADAAAPELAGVVPPARAQLERTWDLVLDHYSIGADYHGPLKRSGARRWLVYHNITPAELLAPWAPAVADRCDTGRRRLDHYLPGYERALADSTFNAEEIRAMDPRGRLPVDVLPICVEPPAGGIPRALPSLERIFSGRGPLFLFAGRIAPQKNHAALLRLLAGLRRGELPGAELLLVGDARGFEVYEQALRSEARRLGLAQAVHFLGKLPAAELWSFYRLASVLCCASRHEGFCVPVVEAFLAGLPVVAFASGAIPETAGDAALLAPPEDEPALAELCLAVLRRPALREELVQRGLQRAGLYSYTALRDRLSRLIPGSSGPPRAR